MNPETEAQATEIVADATRRALEELSEHIDGAKLRACVVLLDVAVPDPEYPDDPEEAYTYTIWKSSPIDMSTTHAYGICAMAAYGMAQNRGPD